MEERIWFQVINRDGTAQTIKGADGVERPMTVGAGSEAEVEEYRKKGWREMGADTPDAPPVEKTPAGTDHPTVPEIYDDIFGAAPVAAGTDEEAPQVDADASEEKAPARNVTGSRRGRR